MATIDMTQATRAINMSFDQLVEFRNVVENTATSWSWFTPGGNDIDLDGSGLTYNANGRALSGTINLIAIDVDNNSESNPDILIRNLSVAAIALDNSSEVFWNSVLGGDDTILGPAAAKVGTQSISQIFGDREDVFLTGGRGGDDIIRAGDATVAVAGDTLSVDSQGSIYQGGADDIFTAPTALVQIVVGDATEVESRGILDGGDDFIIIRSSNATSAAIGDAQFADGGLGTGALVFGGDDRITAEDGSAALLIGDVFAQDDEVTVHGGKDTIKGGTLAEQIAGDVFEAIEDGNATVIGGDDTINGNGGNDTIAGDVFFGASAVAINGGNDVIHGGDGADRIFGELANGAAIVTGGDDQLFGDAGADQLFGQTGNDLLDGGTENDLLDGGAGDDQMFGGEGSDAFRGGVGIDHHDGGAGVDLATYATASAVNIFLDGSGTNGKAAAGDSFTNVENIVGGIGADVIVGDGAANRLSGTTGNDILWGRAGVDQLEGGAGGDRLNGGAGNDVLIGGADADIFMFADAPAVGGLDRTGDFEAGSDKIEIDASAFGGGLAAGGAVQLVANANPSSVGMTGGVFLYNTSNGFLSFDADGQGAGAAVAFFRIQNLPALTAADFVVVA